jgi:outer membrane protein assembly factor BamB
MISPERFLDLLEAKELLSAGTLASIRQQIARSTKPITAETLAQRLVRHGRLTSSQAKRLLAAEEDAPPAPPPQAKEDVLGFAPLEDESDAARPQAGKKYAARLQDRKGEREKDREKKAPSRHPPAPPPAAPPRAHSPRGDEASSLAGASAGGPIDLMSDAATAGAAVGGPLHATASGGRSLWGQLFARQPKGKRGKRSEEEKWGSSLMLVGGGGLMVLILVVVFLVYILNYGSAEKALAAADAEYSNGAYAQAIVKYNLFLEKFSSYAKEASLARVRIGLAQLRQATSTGANWVTAVETADEVIKKISDEPEFREAHAELASMLPTIAKGLTQAAQKRPSAALVEKIRHTLTLIDQYVPKELRPESDLAGVRASLEVTVREIARDDELKKTIEAMRQAIKASKTEDAYTACGALLHRYPTLSGDKKLMDTLLAVSAAQQKLVKTVADVKPAAAGEPETAVVRSITLTQCKTTTRASDGEGYVALAAVDGAVYGLDAATGRVLWRRFVGFDANPRAASFPPTLLSPDPGSDALAIDTGRNELVRLEGATGKIRWRAAIGEPFDAYPVIAGDKILVATRGGRLVTLNATTGERSTSIRFPQPLCVAPVVDVRRSLIYQVATHTNLFVLSLADGVCQHVAYLGHDQASVTTAPVMIDDYLLVIVNGGARSSTMRLYTVEPKRSDRPEPWLKLVQEIPLDGHAQTPPLVEGQRVLVTTTTGIVRVFEISVADAKRPLRDVAETPIKGGDNLTRFAVMQRGQFWIADNRLTKYDVQAARGSLTPKGVGCKDSAFLQPPVVIERAVVVVRRSLGMPGAVVSGVTAENPDRAYWETRLASPLADQPIPLTGGEAVIAVTAAGGVFRCDANASGSAILGKPIAVSDPFRIPQPLARVARLPDGRLAISGGRGCDQIGVFDPASPSPSIDWLKVPGKQQLACPPAAMGRGLLAPTLRGQVFWLDCDPDRGSHEELAEPFQPRIATGAEFDWTVPTVLSDTQVLLCDGRTSIYRVALRDQPTPHLASQAKTDTAKAIASAPVALGDTVFVADTAGALSLMTLPALAHGKDIAVGGPCTWGPARAGDAVLAATDDQLVCFDARGRRLWQVKLEHGALVGAPLRIGGDCVLAAQHGVVWRVDAATGKELGHVDAGYPLATGPVLCGGKLLLGGHDGTLYEVRQP